MKNKKASKQNNTTNNNTKILFVVFISLVVFGICSFFVSLKQNFHFDELGSYALANNQFQVMIADYKVYSGDEVLKDYLTVHEGHQFDFANLVDNQIHDTHPPLWYCMLHIICSIFVGTFSKWYGLIINCIFMIFVYWFMRHLLLIVIKDKTASTIIPLLCLFSNAFINAIVFTRMYIVLETISLAFMCLLIDKMLMLRNNEIESLPSYNNNIINSIIKEKFYILFVILTIVGTLTQYHYMVIAGLMSIVFGVFLLKRKEFKILIKSIISGIIGLVISYAIFPTMLTHIFGSSAGLHSLGNTKRDIDIMYNFIGFVISIRNAFFGNLSSFIVLFIILFIIVVICIVLSYKRKSVNHEIVKIEANDSIFVLLILSFIAFVYYVVISLTATYVFSRYLYNIYPIISIVLFSIVFLLLYNINKNIKYLSLVFVLVSVICSNIKPPVHLYLERKDMLEFMKEHKDIKAVMTYYDNPQASILWKLPDALYDAKDLDEVVFVNIDRPNWEDNDVLKNNDNLFVFVYADVMNHQQYDDEVISKISKNNNLENSMAIYKTSTIHLYMLY